MEIEKTQWMNAQKKEKNFWQKWFKANDNDDTWLDTVVKYFEIKNNDFENKTLVDIGSGPIGILTKLKSEEKIAVDPLELDSIDSSITRIKSPGEEIPLPNEKADIVFIYNVLQHVISPEKVLDEGYRLLKKGGTIYVLEQLNLPTNELHPHSLNDELFENWINKNEFEIIKKNKENNCYFDHPNAKNPNYSILCLILKKI